jgi:hypothetical protein
MPMMVFTRTLQFIYITVVCHFTGSIKAYLITCHKLDQSVILVDVIVLQSSR